MLCVAIRSIVPAGCLAVLVLAVVRVAQSAEPEVVVLDNGHVLTGQVISEGDHVVVVFAPGSRIAVPASRVRFRAPSLAEAFRMWSDRIDPQRIDERCGLIDWAIQYRLFREAEEELRRLEHQRPGDARLARLRLKLQYAQIYAQKPAVQHEPSVSAEQVEAAIADVPAAAVSQFAEFVQPLLINRCAMAGCHGPMPRSEFRLSRLPGNTRIVPRLTQRNLYAVLQLLDAADPDRSPLLERASSAHGGLEQPPLGRAESTHLELLRRWVRTAVRREEPAIVETTPRVPEDLLQVAPLVSPVGAGSASARWPAELPISPHRAERSAGTAEGAAASDPVRPQSSQPAFVPRDPFDPQLFNRRFFGAGGVHRSSGVEPNEH